MSRRRAGEGQQRVKKIKGWKSKGSGRITVEGAVRSRPPWNSESSENKPNIKLCATTDQPRRAFKPPSHVDGSVCLNANVYRFSATCLFAQNRHSLHLCITRRAKVTLLRFRTGASGRRADYDYVGCSATSLRLVCRLRVSSGAEPCVSWGLCR